MNYLGTLLLVILISAITSQNTGLMTIGALLLVILISAITSQNTGLMTIGNSKDSDKNFCTFQ